MRIAAAALVLVLGGCGDTAADKPADQPPSPSVAVRGPPPAVATPATGEPPATLTLQADGFCLRGTGSVQPMVEVLAFATPRAMVEAAAQRAFPGVAPTREGNAECPAGPMAFTSYGQLTLNFQNDRFVGWFVRDGSAVATTDGIRPGITRAQLENERGVDMDQRSTIDGMFTYAVPDGTAIGGVMDGAGGAARVTALYSGINCFFT